MILRDIFRVLYSPLKAFEEIARAPNLKGPLVVLLVTLLASASAQYISSSKILLKTESGAYIPLTATDLFSDQLILTLTNSMIRFFFNWLLYGAIVLLILRIFRAKEGPWHQLFILIGYTFIVTAVFVFVTAMLISTFPTLNFDFDTWTKAFLENDAQAQDLVVQKYDSIWAPLPAYQIASNLFIAVEIWIVALSAIGIHFLREVSWNKALSISTTVSIISLFLRGPLV